MKSEVRVSGKRLGGQYIIDIRRFRDNHPTKRGVSITQENVDAVIQQIRQAYNDNETRRHITAKSRA